jgi:membrane-associated phospholipid phosphatase
MTFTALTLRQHVINRLLWITVTIVGIIDLALAKLAGIEFDISKATIFLVVVGGCVGLSLFYRYVRRDDQIYLLAQITNQIIIATAALGVFSYLTTMLNLDLLDEQLIAIDRALYFDWREYIAWVDRHPLLVRLSSLAYLSCGPQIMILAGLMFIYQQSAQIQRFILAFLASALITIILAMLFPAVAGYVYYNIDITAYQHLRPAAERLHEVPYMNMRNHVTKVLAFPLQGLITFPSFHSALAVLLIYLCRPVRWLFVISLILNIAVLFATPVDGGHYLIDVLGGIAVAFVGMCIAERLFPRGT